ncbi:MAG: uroporphyrinogen-III C-methyltransferase [Actinomycetota bacterium]
MSATRKRQRGNVTLVAAGPGDIDLLTVRATRALSEADLIIADSEVVAIARKFAQPSAEIAAAVDADGLPLEQAARSKAVVDAAKEGRTVVRLMSGDPVIDGAFGRESAALTKAKLIFDYVPGVSTVSGVAGYAGVSLTSTKSREIRIVDGAQPDVKWQDHISSAVTLVILNGADRAVDIAKALVKAGRDGATSVVLTRDGTTVDQRSVISSLEEIPAAVKAARHAGNGIMIVGEPVSKRNELSWYEAKPLFGWRVLLPRTKDSLKDLVAQLESLGATVTDVPTLSVEQPRTPQQMDRAIHGLVSGRYEWIIFTSHNAVRAVWEKCQEYGLDARAFSGLKIAATGDKTIEQLAAFGIRPDTALSEEQTTADLLEDFPQYDMMTDPINRIFLPRADIATESLAAGLVELGWEVDDVTAYRTVRAAPPAVEIRDAIKAGGFDAVVFTSSSTVRNLVGIAGKPHPATVVACIGPQTAKTCEEHGLQVDVMAAEPNTTSLLESLADHGFVLRDAALELGETSWRPSRRRTTVRRKVT